MRAESIAGLTASHRGGSGSPMVCLHGFTGSWRVWELVLAQLERHHDVLAPTLRRSGRSRVTPTRSCARPRAASA